MLYADGADDPPPFLSLDHIGYVLSRESNQCSTCPHHERARRGCPHTAETHRAHMAPVPSCPVLDVPPWVWPVMRIGALALDGAIGPGDVSVDHWDRGTRIVAAYRHGLQQAEERKAKRKR